MIYIKSEDIPRAVQENFSECCGWSDASVTYNEYGAIRDKLLTEYNATRLTSNGSSMIVFESEAHYTWFIMRWS